MKKDINTNKSAFVSVIIVNWNGFAYTINCLDSLSKINYRNYETIIVDNDSSDDSIIEISKWLLINGFSYKIYNYVGKEYVFKYTNDYGNDKIKKISIIKAEKNNGFSAGNNIGIKKAYLNGAKYFILLNNDTAVNENFITEIINCGDSNNKIGIVGANIYDEDGFASNSFCKFPRIYRAILAFAGIIRKNSYYAINCRSNKYRVECPSGACFAIKRSVIDKIGYLSEEYFLFSEEVDFAYRARKSGYKSCISAKTRIIHYGGKSTENIGNDFKIELLYKSLYKYLCKYNSRLYARIYLKIFYYLHKSRSIAKEIKNKYRNHCYNNIKKINKSNSNHHFIHMKIIKRILNEK